jgi:phage/plasmid-associated DNA primase
MLKKEDNSKIFKFVSRVSYQIQTRILNTFFVKYKKSYKEFCKMNEKKQSIDFCRIKKD